MDKDILKLEEEIKRLNSIIELKEKENFELNRKLQYYMDKYIHELAVGKIDIICKLKQTLENIAQGNIGKCCCAEEYASKILKEV